MNVNLNPLHYRDGTITKMKNVNFVLNAGGIGDYICALTALEWVSRTQFHVKPTIYSPKFFLEIAENAFSKYKHVEVKDKIYFDTSTDLKDPTYCPQYECTINGTGTHLVDMGFINYCNLNGVPENESGEYVRLDLDNVKLHRFSLPKKYLVLTPCSTEKARTMLPSLFNSIQDYALSQGLEVVYIGREDFAPGRKSTISSEYDLSKGTNLINKTSLLEAAKVMHESVAVAGVDNGMLHLAAMTNAPLIFGYTIVSPKFRQPIRPDSTLTVNIVPNKKELPCLFCMENMRYFFNHDFKTCIYKDEACTKLLAQDTKVWEEALHICMEANV